MGFQDYIGESEACAFAGVSPSTLRRFAEAGYFQIETDSDGLRLFSKSEIENLFGLKPMSGGRPKPNGQTSSSPSPFSSSPPGASPNGTATVRPPASPPRSPAHEVTPTERPAGESMVLTANRTATTVVRARVDESPTLTERPEPPPYSPNLLHTESSSRGIALEALEREVTKLQNIVGLQEKLLDLREEEIKNIKGERDWLRGRIEKLEEKNERDQLLLLAETQTVRQLINLQQRKRSTVQLALEWLGLKPIQPNPGQPIEITSTAARNAASDPR